MQARATLSVELVAGRSRCTELRSDPPLSLRETATGVHLVASGAGPVGGDDLRLTVRVGPGATLDLRSVAASMVHPGPSGRPSTLTIDVEVGDHGRVSWTPQPAILVRGCDHRALTRLRLGHGSSVVWREEVVLGRHGETSGSVLQRLRVDAADGPLLRTDVAVGPRWPASLGPAGTGSGARAVGTLLVAGPDARADRPVLADPAGVRWASSTLGVDATRSLDAHLITAVAETAAGLRDTFDALAARSQAGAGSPASLAARPGVGTEPS